MPNVLDEMPLELLGGHEQLTAKVGPPLQLVDYWRWAGSVLMENTLWGVLAEFLVAVALGLWASRRASERVGKSRSRSAS